MASPLVIYLDQNKWIEFLRSEASGSETSTNAVLTKLRASVESGQAVVPLSAGHYLETWHRCDWVSRHKLARLMAEISDYVTLAPVQHLLCLEVESLLLRRFRNRQCRCEVPSVQSMALGRGVNHAFNSTTGRLRFVDNIATATQSEGPPVHLGSDFMHLISAIPKDAYEWWNLAGPEDDLQYDDFETRSEHRIGREYVDIQEDLADFIAKDTYAKSRLRDYLIARELELITDVFNRMAFWHAAGTNAMMNEFVKVGPEYGRELVDSLPTRACIVGLLYAKHRNAEWKWQQHDSTDIAALAAAVPYADVVVTERQWAHELRAAKLDRRFNTTVLSKIGDLAALL